MIKRVVALGFFDGVHIGHGALLKKTADAAMQKGAVPAVMTYSRHPSEIVGKVPVRLINSTEERCALISELYGIDEIIVKDFNKEYASLSCEEFFEEIVVRELCACHIVAGFDFRFGRGGAGDAEKLRELCTQKGIGCDIISAVTHCGEAVSSSRIRKLIENGDMLGATELLGHHHCIISEIRHGKSLGTRIGFPTVNQEFSSNIQLPKFGVYASLVTIDKKKYRGVTNIGTRPTVAKDEPPRAETNILDFCEDIYGEKIKVELVRFLRDEKRFSSVEELAGQIERDIKNASACLTDVF